MDYIVRVTLLSGEVHWLTKPAVIGFRRLSDRASADEFPSGQAALEAIIHAKLAWSEGQLTFEVEEQLRPAPFAVNRN